MAKLTTLDYDHGTWGSIPAQWGDVGWGGQLTSEWEHFDVVGEIEVHPGWEDATSRAASPLRTYITRRWRLFLAGGRELYLRGYSWGEVGADISPRSGIIQVEGSGGFFLPLQWGQPWTLWGEPTTSWGGHFSPMLTGTILFEFPSESVGLEAYSGQSLISKPGSLLRGRPAQWFVPFIAARTLWSLPLEGEIRVDVAAREGTVESAYLADNAVHFTMWGGYSPLIMGWGKKSSTWGGMLTDNLGAEGEVITATISPGNKTYT